MRQERNDNSGLVDYIPPYDKGDIISLPDAPGGELEIINVGDSNETVIALGTAHGGSTIIIPVGTQLRKVWMEKYFTLETSQEEKKQKLSLRGYLYTIEPGGGKRYDWYPEKGWNDPRNS